jgi:RNA polymerase sigma-70 factor (ECF subfamily)
MHGGQQMHDDRELVQRVLQGERSAFDTLVARYHAAVFRQALRRVRRPEDAEEVAQNVFVKAYVGLPRLQRAADFEHWLRVITARESISWLRRAHPETEPAPDGELMEQDATSPEEALLAGELRAAVRQALNSLPEHERRVAHAYYFDGESYREIERRYGLAHSSIAGYLYRARHRLADRLKGVLPGFTCMPGLASWCQTAWRMLLEGDRPMHVTKAAVAAASVVTVAMVARQAPRPHAHRLSAAPPAIATAAVADSSDARGALDGPRAARSHTRLLIASGDRPLSGGPVRRGSDRQVSEDVEHLADQLMRTVASAADLALGTEVAAADQEPPAPKPGAEPDAPATAPEPKAAPGGLIRAGENEFIFRQDGHTRRLFMKEGKLFIEEEGQTRPATEEEAARFKLIQERIAALKARAEEIRARAETARAQGEARAKALEQAHEAAAEARAKALERAAEALERSTEARVEAQEKTLEALRARAVIEAQRARAEAKRAKAGEPGDERDAQRLKSEVDKLARSQVEAARATARIQAAIKPLLEKIGPLAAEAAKAGQPNPEEIQKLVAEVLAQLEPILKEAASLGEEAARLGEEFGKLKEKGSPNAPKKAEPKEKPSPEKAKPAPPGGTPAPEKPGPETAPPDKSPEPPPDRDNAPPAPDEND